MRSLVDQTEVSRPCRLITFERIILLGEQYPQGFGEAININGVWVCRRGLSEHLVRHVVAGAHGPSVGRERLGVGHSDQAEIAHEILAIDFKEVAGFDVSMPDSVLLLQPRQRLRNRADRRNDVLDARTRQRLVKRSRYGHCQPCE